MLNDGRDVLAKKILVSKNRLVGEPLIEFTVAKIRDVPWMYAVLEQRYFSLTRLIGWNEGWSGNDEGMGYDGVRRAERTGGG